MLFYVQNESALASPLFSTLPAICLTLEPHFA